MVTIGDPFMTQCSNQTMPPNIKVPNKRIVSDGEADVGLSSNSRKNFPIVPSR